MIFDKVIKNGFVVDPASNIEEEKNIGIIKDKISAVTSEELLGREYFDACGEVVAPGFIDVHSHIDGNFYSSELSLRQGITTVIGGNCGSSPIDIADFFAEQESHPRPVNQAELIGMTTSMRTKLGGLSPLTAAGSEQIKKMSLLVEKALDDGACGLSIGLAYAPGTSDEEVYALSSLTAKYGRIITVDTRMLTPLDLYSLVEVIRLGRITGARILVSHFVYQYGTGLVTEALAAVSKAREEGIDIRLDSGMYTQWATGLQSVLFDPNYLKENKWRLEDILVITGSYRGRRLDPELYDLLRKNSSPAEHISVIVFTGIEDEIYTSLLYPWCMPSTDTGRYLPGEGHPQIAGSFPRYFRKMVTEKKLLTLKEAVRKATILPAETIGLKTKGRLAVGYDADIVIFQPDNIKDNAGFLPKAKPDAPPEGISRVFVNGSLALEHGVLKDAQAGRPIKF